MFEYKIQRVPMTGEKGEEALNALGKEGFELVAQAQYGTDLFCVMMKQRDPMPDITPPDIFVEGPPKKKPGRPKKVK